MSDYVKDLYDNNLVKGCSKCGIISIKSNFHGDIKKVWWVNTSL